MSQLLLAYWISTGIGFVFIVGSAFLGHFHGSEELEAQGDPGDVDAGSGDPGDVDASAGDPGDVDGGDPGDVDAGDQNSPNQMVKDATSGAIANNKHNNRGLHIYLKLVGFFSPIKLSLLFFFTGVVGVMTLLLFPGLGNWSLLPAGVLGYVISKLLLNVLSMAVTKLHTSTNFKQESLIGTVGVLTLSIKPGSLGEVLIPTRGSRHSAPARALDPNASIANNDKVIVSDFREGIFYVEKAPKELDLDYSKGAAK